MRSFFILLLLVACVANAQSLTYEKELAPPNTPTAFTWWNLLHYSIAVTPDYSTKSISGTNIIRFSSLQAGRLLRLDLDKALRITAVKWKDAPLDFKRGAEGYAIWFPEEIKKGQTTSITVFFEGTPKAASNPPYDNGWIWATDKQQRPWISVACQGSGASVWLPCKDVLYDEPDNGVLFSITVPDTLVAIANGKLQGKKRNKNGTTTSTWKVTSPINNYNIIPYIGNYVSWKKDYAGIKGKLDCRYWVLDYNLDRAKQHLQQTDTMLRAFEYWLGPYPFYKDGYQLVEAPMQGMEHQSAIAYGNGFQNGYNGKDLFGTGWGLKWDFILVHESGHEWFGNSISCSNHGDTWIHEGFTKYLETLYTNFVFGAEAGNDYAIGTWKRIKNDQPILGTGTTDKYYKGSAMLHMIRQITGDSVFRGWLQSLGHSFYHRAITTGQVLQHLNTYTKKDFSKVFDQYLKTTQVPVLEYQFQNNKLRYRWSECVDGFDMPVKVSYGNSEYQFIFPTTGWKEVSPGKETNQLVPDKNFYVKSINFQ